MSHALALELTQVAEGFPPSERFGLTSQLRRAALSVPTNIAEGQARHGPRKALRYARIAAGSLAEVEYLLFFAKEKGYLGAEAYDRLDARRKHANLLLSRLVRSLRRPKK